MYFAAAGVRPLLAARRADRLQQEAARLIASSCPAAGRAPRTEPPATRKERPWRLVAYPRRSSRGSSRPLLLGTAGRFPGSPRPTSRRPSPPPPAPTCRRRSPRTSASTRRRSSQLSEWIRKRQARRAQLPGGQGRQARSSSATATGSTATTTTSSTPSPRPSPRWLFGILAGEGKISPDDKIADLDREGASGIQGRPRGQAGHRAAPPAVDVERPLLQAGRGHRPALLLGARPVAGGPDDGRQAAAGHAVRVHRRQPRPRRRGDRTAAGEPEDKLPRSGCSSLSACGTTAGPAPTRPASVSGGWGLRLRAVDMAKLGLVMLHGGQWQGRQVVPRSWIGQMSTPSASREGLRLLLLDQPHRRDRARVRRDGLQGPVHHRAAEGERGRGDDQHPADRRRSAGRHLPEPLPAHGERLRAARHARHDPTPRRPRRLDQALRDELELSARSQGVPGTALAFNDGPEKK